MDELKKSSEGARNAIRWLESEFSKGSRFLRLQRSHETLAIPLLKVPRKLRKFYSQLSLKVEYKKGKSASAFRSPVGREGDHYKVHNKRRSPTVWFQFIIRGDKKGKGGLFGLK